LPKFVLSGGKDKKLHVPITPHTRASGPGAPSDAVPGSLVPVLQGHGELSSLGQWFACSFPGMGHHPQYPQRLRDLLCSPPGSE